MNEIQKAKSKNSSSNAMYRQDILVENDPKIVAVVQKEAKRLREDKKPLNVTRHDDQIMIRKSLIESDKSDPNGYERIIGASELVSVNFLTRGLRAAAAVCRIRVPHWAGNGTAPVSWWVRAC